MNQNQVVLRCGEREHVLHLSNRDIHLLDGRFFAPPQSARGRGFLGLDFVAGLELPPRNKVLITHSRKTLLSEVRALLSGFEDHRDRLGYSYRYRFSLRPGGGGGGSTSGFRVRRLFGFVSVQPAGYCDLTLSESGPTGVGRVVEIVDMRHRGEVETDDWGTLSVSRRAANVGWLTVLPSAIEWLEEQPDRHVEIMHR